MFLNESLEEYTRLYDFVLDEFDIFNSSTTTPPFYNNKRLVGFVSKATVRTFSFVFGMVLIPVFSLFGCMGNILSLTVLAHHRMRNTINICLAALAVSDFLVLFHSFWYGLLNIYKTQDAVAGENLRLLTYPVLGVYGSVVTARITSWLTAMLSIERFIAVYCPIKAKAICGKRLTCIGISVIYIATAVAFIPQSLKYTARYIFDNKTNTTNVILKRSILGRDKNFCIVYGTLLNVIFRFVPIVLLIVLNMAIIIAIRKTWSLRRIITTQGSHAKVSEQNRITIMLLTVSGIFLVCILPGALSSIASQIKTDYSRLGHQRNLYFCISNVTYFLETVNSSVNFIIYKAFSRKFCRTYRQIFCCDSPGKIRNDSKREIIRFSKRPVGSSSSNTSSQELRSTYIMAEQRNGYTPRLDFDQRLRSVRIQVERKYTLACFREPRYVDFNKWANRYN